MHNLQEKWGDLFDLLDTNADSKIDMADVKFTEARYIRLNNLTAQEVCTIHELLLKKPCWNHANRGRLLLRTNGPVTFGLALILILRPFFPEFVMSTDLLSFDESAVPHDTTPVVQTW